MVEKVHGFGRRPGPSRGVKALEKAKAKARVAR
jgi:hypothetical protein